MEYHDKYPDSYKLASLKRIILEYRYQIKVVCHFKHYASDQIYIDFTGDRLEVVDEMTDETKKAKAFIASFHSVIMPTAKPYSRNARTT